MLQKRRPVCQFASGDSIGVSVLNCFIDSSFPAGQKLEGICLPVLRADKGCVLCATLESDQCLFFFFKGPGESGMPAWALSVHNPSVGISAANWHICCTGCGSSERCGSPSVAC